MRMGSNFVFGHADGVKLCFLFVDPAEKQKTKFDPMSSASLRYGLTYRCEDPPAARRHGAPQIGCGCAVTACR